MAIGKLGWADASHSPQISVELMPQSMCSSPVVSFAASSIGVIALAADGALAVVMDEKDECVCRALQDCRLTVLLPWPASHSYCLAADRHSKGSISGKDSSSFHTRMDSAGSGI